MMSVVLALVALRLGSPVEGAHTRQWIVIKTITERCSKDVWISPKYYATIVNQGAWLNRLNATPYTAWSTPMIVQQFGPGRRIRWWCGGGTHWTAERSKCAPGTIAVQARLGPNRLLEIRCLK
jgi:hypothetical protein